jgi:hypothetical protein
MHHLDPRDSCWAVAQEAIGLLRHHSNPERFLAAGLRADRDAGAATTYKRRLAADRRELSGNAASSATAACFMPRSNST